MGKETNFERAARLYAELITRNELVPAKELAALVKAHPELEAELEGVHATWRHLRGRSAASGTSPTRNPALAASQSRARLHSEILDRLSRRPAQPDRYTDNREIARGGMGAILEVRDQDLGRHLAMKVISTDSSGSMPSAPSIEPRMLARFLEEAQVTAQLDHPGIVPVHEVGVDAEGRVFFTMKLVKGRDLSVIFDLVRKGTDGWTQRRALGLFLRICEAMSYAHSKGVIHRDLKPANVMVGRFGEVYVMDWGLARILGKPDRSDEPQGAGPMPTAEIRSARRTADTVKPGQELLTNDGDVIGTPVYMSPEQAQGRLAEMGPQSDVYSLGAMIYHLLAGHMPHSPSGAAPDIYKVLALTQAGPPEPIAERAPDASPELVAICEKAMARETGERYGDMESLRADLSAYLDGRVVGAYESGALAELRKWIGRNRLLSFASGAAVLALVAGLVVSIYLGNEARRQRSNVLNLSAYSRLDLLHQRADEIWPVAPRLIPAYEDWLREAQTLLDGLDGKGGSTPGGHLAQLESLRAEGTRLSPEAFEAAAARSPDQAQLLTLERELSVLRRSQEVRNGAAPDLLASLSPELKSVSPGVLNELAWPLVMPDRTEFGREDEGLALALLALESAGPSTDRAKLEDTLAWAYFAQGRDEEAKRTSQDALEHAPESEREVYEANLERLERAVEEATGQAGAEQRARLEAQIARLRRRIEGQVAWQFADEETSWWHERLSTLVDELALFADSQTGLIDGIDPVRGWGIRRRLEAAQRMQRLTDPRGAAAEAWKRASIEVSTHPAYRGLELVPQVGLLPIGADPQSQLFEFAHVASGEVPARSDEGHLMIDEATCVVLVLIPGDSFLIGAQAVHADGPNYDPRAENDEALDSEAGTLKTETIAPFFLSKYEFTQAQWERAAASNPSTHRFGRVAAGRTITGMNPVEHISWKEAVRVLARLDLELPTEARWEYAARGMRSTPWYCGESRACLQGIVNIADQSAAAAGIKWSAIDDWPELDDGFAYHAPIGSFDPNPFGLHEILGNVQEWCLDSRAEYSFPSRAGTAERIINGATQRVTRGGGFTNTADQVRVSYRLPRGPEYRYSSLGVRPARSLRKDG